MKAHWLNIDCGLATTWRTCAAFVAVSCTGGVAGATVVVPATAIAKTNPRGVPGGLVARRMQ